VLWRTLVLPALRELVRIVAKATNRRNAYRYSTRLRKHAVNANLPFVGLWLVVSQRLRVDGLRQFERLRLCAPDTSSASHAFESSGVSIAVEREEICGDAWEVIETAGSLRAMVVDGLGHGPFAGEAAREALAVFRSQATTGLASTLKLVDQALTKTRGAAGAIVELCPAKGHVTAAGVGNISMRLVNDGESKSFGCDNGTLGTGVPRIREFTQPWVHGSVLVMHSDGVKTHWTLDDYPGLGRRHPGLVAGLLYRDFRRERDDVTVMVARHYL
jgi:Stage II sporulation protein E (SpoIIE)